MTIFALSSAPGRAGIAVIRVSGEAARKVLHKLCRGRVPEPRRAALRQLFDPGRGEAIDTGLVLFFPAPKSFTGEDMAEFHVHGSRAVVSAMFEALARLGLRMAEPGEFARRAFENGKLDLTEVEGLSDLINAETSVQRRQALSQASGRLRERYDDWRARLLRAMAYVEASLDFADEGDVSRDAFAAAIPEAKALLADLDRALSDGCRGEIVREGVQVAIVGAPNVGKSSLLNALAGRDAAIVFDEPGTTRDVVEISLDLDGFAFVVRDTAGLREAAGPVEQEGIRRALAAAERSDLVIVVADASSASRLPPQWEMRSEARAAQVIAVANKIDLAPAASLPPAMLPISAKTGAGLDALKSALVAFARRAYGTADTPLITRARHRQGIERARDAIRRFLEAARAPGVEELAAEHLREAADALGRLTGRLDVDDVLGEIFSEFCIGK